MPIYPLPVYSEEEELEALKKLKPPKTIVVRYGYLKQIGEFPYDGDQVIGCGTKVVVRTPRGVELGDMLTTTCSNSGCGKSISRQQMLQYIDNSGGKQFPFTTDGKVVRVATVEDLNEQSRLDSDKSRYVKAAREAIRELDLPMKLVDVEPLLSRDKIVFYFLSEERIDFRELVRKLAAVTHVRVEMRQVGARDEARVVADYEKCGQHCCCKQFLKVLKPVSMKSAKIQKATLDPAKISGRCGRLMCCLRYEDQTYDELRKNLPNRKSRVMTEDGPGIVISSQILTQLVLVELDNGQRNAYPLENIEVLTGEAAKMHPRPEPPEPYSREGGRRGGGPPEARGGRDGDRRDDRRDRGPRAERDQRPPRDERSEPRRPQPGKPLRGDEVESREGDRADSLAEPIDHEPMIDDEPQTLASDDAQDHGDDLAPDAATVEGAASPEGTDTSGQGDERRRRRRRRRRRGRGRPGGPGGPAGEGGPASPPNA